MAEIKIGDGPHVTTTIRNFDYENLGGKYHLSECRIMWNISDLPLKTKLKLYLDSPEGQTAVALLEENKIEELDHLFVSLMLRSIHVPNFLIILDNYGNLNYERGKDAKIDEFESLMIRSYAH